MADGTYFINKYHFQDPQMADLARQIASIINGGIGSINLTALATSSLTGKYCVSFLFDGDLIDETVYGIFYLPDNASITKHMLFVGEVADADITVDILKNDVAQSQIATLSSGAESELTTLGSPITFLSTDKFSLKTKSIGSESAPGVSLTSVIYYSI